MQSWAVTQMSKVQFSNCFTIFCLVGIKSWTLAACGHRAERHQSIYIMYIHTHIELGIDTCQNFSSQTVSQYCFVAVESCTVAACGHRVEKNQSASSTCSPRSWFSNCMSYMYVYMHLWVYVLYAPSAACSQASCFPTAACVCANSYACVCNMCVYALYIIVAWVSWIVIIYTYIHIHTQYMNNTCTI